MGSVKEDVEVTKEELRDILNRMYDLRGSYSDEQISKEQYDYYIEMLDQATKSELKETITRIVFELDIEKETVARKIAYPFSFNQKVIDWMNSQIVDGEYMCAKCGVMHKYGTDNADTILHIDHEPALSTRFNCGEYKLDRNGRRESFNDINRLQLMCARENIKKGGERYNPRYVEEVFLREL